MDSDICLEPRRHPATAETHPGWGGCSVSQPHADTGDSVLSQVRLPPSWQHLNPLQGSNQGAQESITQR